MAAEPSGVDILIERLALDGSESELQLEGDLDDVRALIGLFVSEGSCVRVVIEPPANGEATPGAPELGIDPAEFAAAQPVLP